jgi:hypothetical protein
MKNFNFMDVANILNIYDSHCFILMKYISENVDA